MESYRFKNQVGSSNNNRKKLLLPLSGGVSSLALLEVLDRQIRRQLEQQGRTAYDLVLCHICLSRCSSESEDPDGTKIEEWWERRLRSRYSLHSFVPLIQLHEIVGRNDQSDSLDSALQTLGFTGSSSSSESSEALLARLIESARTATSRSDLMSILLRRSIVRAARQNGCSSILWGHSDTQLAALTLSAVAKGRGASVADDLADGPAAFAPDLTFNHPVRELYKHELQVYVDTLDDSLRNLVFEHDAMARSVENVPVSLKQTSIDQLLSVYIKEQGEKYPGIMANVVKTAGKLDVGGRVEIGRCVLCTGSMINGSRELGLCYGCERLKQDIRAG